MNGFVQAPTHAAMLELKNEQMVVNEAYIFLDEKRMLLASELRRQLRLYQQLSNELDALHVQSKEVIQSAVMHHGLDGLQVYQAASFEGAVIKRHTYNFMGVTLLEAELSTENVENLHLTAPIPSSKVDDCRQLFHDIVVQNTVLAGISGNLYRLLREYRLTERRSRALEYVILPEIDKNLREVMLHLEELDLEDAVRVYLQSGTKL